jgi:hypothetical protein
LENAVCHTHCADDPLCSWVVLFSSGPYFFHLRSEEFDIGPVAFMEHVRTVQGLLQDEGSERKNSVSSPKEASL